MAPPPGRLCLLLEETSEGACVRRRGRLGSGRAGPSAIWCLRVWEVLFLAPGGRPAGRAASLSSCAAASSVGRSWGRASAIPLLIFCWACSSVWSSVCREGRSGCGAAEARRDAPWDFADGCRASGAVLPLPRLFDRPAEGASAGVWAGAECRVLRVPDSAWAPFWRRPELLRARSSLSSPPAPPYWSTPLRLSCALVVLPACWTTMSVALPFPSLPFS